MPAEKFFEIGVSRHAPKVEPEGAIVNVAEQEMDRERAAAEIEEPSRLMLENLEKAPAGAVMALEPSNIKRAEQTRGLFVDQLRQSLQGRSDIEIVELGGSREESEKALATIKSQPDKKFIISDLRGTWLIGFKEDDESLPALNKWKNKLEGDENMVGKIWAAHPDEIPVLTDELKERGFDIPGREIKPQEFQRTPEEQVRRFVRWMQAMKKIGESHFPDRPLILEGVSHNLRSDYTTLALLGEDISVESIDRVLGGNFREPFERSSVTFAADGGVRIKFRDIEKEYTAAEFAAVVGEIDDKMADRKEEWERANSINNHH
jgi:hypothetical protein